MSPRDRGKHAPLLLALETATPFASVGLLEGEVLVAEVNTTGNRPHSGRLLPAVDRLFELSGRSLDAVDAFALSIGPGSFTGLRIGLATLKGLAFGDERPVAAVPTLAGLARAAGGPPHPVVACLDARRGEFYAAGYSGADAASPVLAEGVYDAEGLARLLPRPCTLVGCAGEEQALESLRQRLADGDLHWAEPQLPRALHVGRLGARLLARGQGQRVEALVPRYVRRAEAEVKRTGRRFEPGTNRQRSL